MSSEYQNQSAPVDLLARAVHWSLLIGLVLSGVLMCVGLAVSISRHEHAPELPPPHFAKLLHLAIGGDGPALLEIGILLLLFTPIVRVMVLAIGWGVRRDGRMALVALTVLVLLTISLVLGAG
ncbi:MAG TPA: DUF1634 domain-containing protein [Pirellulales bacterium]|jgi:uncharacterized membrane protein